MRLRKEAPAKEIPLSINFFVGRGALFVKCLWTTVWVQGHSLKASWCNTLALQQRREMNCCCSGLASAVGRSAGHRFQLGAEAWARKLERELSLEKYVWLSTSLLLQGGKRIEEVGEQINKLENLACHFAKLGGHRLPQIEVWAIVRKPN